MMSTLHEGGHQLGSGPNCIGLNNSPKNPNHMLTGNSQGGKSSYSNHV